MKKIIKVLLTSLFAMLLAGCSVDKAYDLGKINGDAHVAEYILLPENSSTTTAFEILGAALSTELGISREEVRSNWPSSELMLPDGSVTIDYQLNSELPEGIVDKLDEQHNTITLETVVDNDLPLNLDISIEFVSSEGNSYRLELKQAEAMEQGRIYTENIPLDKMKIMESLEYVNVTFGYSFPAPAVVPIDEGVMLTFKFLITGGIEL